MGSSGINSNFIKWVQANAAVPGKSAYEIAVLHGFPGTEQEWLNSLKGDVATLTPEQLSNIASQVDISGKVDKVTGSSLVPDTEIAKIHALGADNQDLSRYVETDDDRLYDARTPLTHYHPYEPANNNIQQHIETPHAPAGAQVNADITKAEIEAKLTGTISTHTHSGGAADMWTVVKLSGDFITSLATNEIVPNFRFTPLPNKTYLVFGYFLLRTATATIGARPGVAWPSNLTDATIRIEAANSLTASAIQLFGARTTKNAASTGLATTTESHWGSLDGIMITSGTTSGNFQITLASETAGTNVTMKAGSILMYREL